MSAMPNIKITFLKSDGTRKVEVFQRTDNTFGFEELKFGEQEKAWFPVGKYSFAFIDSLESAVKEAKGRVAWLSEGA